MITHHAGERQGSCGAGVLHPGANQLSCRCRHMSRTCSQCAPRPSHEALRSLIAPLLPTTGDDYDKMIKGDPGVEVSGFAAAHSCSARRSCICLARRTTASKPCVTAASTGGNHMRVGAHACLHARMPACMLAQHPVLPTHPANPPLNRPPQDIYKWTQDGQNVPMRGKSGVGDGVQ